MDSPSFRSRKPVVAVECMFTWYWLADLCRSEQIAFLLGHALYMKAIHGGKAKNDRIDARVTSDVNLTVRERMVGKLCDPGILLSHRAEFGPPTHEDFRSPIKGSELQRV